MLELLNEVLGDAGFRVEILGNIEELSTHTDFRNVVICDELAGVLDGQDVWPKVKDQPDTAFLLLADDIAGHRLAACLNDGMHEVVCKPFDVEELHARILKTMRWLELAAAPKAAEEPVLALRPSFEGDLEYLGLPDILLNLKQNSRTGELTTSVNDGDYAFSFLKGELVRVEGPRGLKHRKALFRALRETSGTFAFQVMDTVRPSRNKFENLDNLVLQAMQEADEYPLYRERLPPDPVPVTLTQKVESIKLPEGTVIQPLLEGLIKSTTIDILIHASPRTDLQAARELKELMDQDVLGITTPSERAS
jgi:CheY-like chemotaxis protein